MSLRPIEYNNKQYASIRALARDVNVDYDLLRQRLAMGMSIHEAIHKKKRASGQRPIRVHDHEGNIFPNITKMLAHYNISRDVFYTRIRNHWSLKDSLTIPQQYYREDRGID